MKRITTLAALALASLLVTACSEESPEAKAKSLKAEIADIQKQVADATGDDKASLEAKLKELQKELKEVTAKMAEEAGEKVEEGMDKAKELLGGDK